MSPQKRSECEAKDPPLKILIGDGKKMVPVCDEDELRKLAKTVLSRYSIIDGGHKDIPCPYLVQLGELSDYADEVLAAKTPQEVANAAYDFFNALSFVLKKDGEEPDGEEDYDFKGEDT